MPFLRAGFNAKHRHSGIMGWTRALTGSRFEPARLIQFQAGDYAWLGIGERFLAWGEQVVLGSWYEFDLPWDYQNGLAHSDLDTRREHAATKWSDD